MSYVALVSAALTGTATLLLTLATVRAGHEDWLYTAVAALLTGLVTAMTLAGAW